MDLLTGVAELFKPEDFIILSVVVVLSFFGSIGKDYLRFFKFHLKMNLIRILLSTVTSSICVFAGSERIVALTGIRGLMAASFIIGLVGFDLLQRLSSLDGLISLVENLLDIMRAANETTHGKPLHESEDPANDDHDDVSK